MARPSERELNEFAGRVLDFLDRKGEIGVAFLNASEIRSINRRYRGVDKTTNVLSIEAPVGFPIPANEEKPAYLGDIYLSPTYIEKHGEDFYYLLTHGLLHLLGFNHDTADDKMRMEEAEKRILTALKK